VPHTNASQAHDELREGDVVSTFGARSDGSTGETRVDFSSVPEGTVLTFRDGEWRVGGSESSD
jgi:hypothetical protein